MDDAITTPVAEVKRKRHCCVPLCSTDERYCEGFSFQKKEWIVKIRQVSRLTMCRWGCAGINTTFMCKWCGTRFCKECLKGEFTGKMFDELKCRKCNQINCQGQKVEFVINQPDGDDGKPNKKDGKKDLKNRSRSKSPDKGKSSKSSKKGSKKSGKKAGKKKGGGKKKKKKK